MGAIKEKMFDIAELIQEMIDDGIKDYEIDIYLEEQLSPEEYQFYQQNKDVIFREFLGYIDESVKIPRINEDSFDEQEWLESDDDEEDYNDDLADYEWQVGSILTEHLADEGLLVDSDNLGDALSDKMSFIYQCMKDGREPEECANELINDVEFMSYIVDEEDEDDNYIDESIIMPRINESYEDYEDDEDDEDWTFQIGDEVIFDIEDMEMEWEDDEDQGEDAISHSGLPAIIVAQATATEVGDKDYEYYDIKFRDGLVLDAVSGYHLTPITNEAISRRKPNNYINEGCGCGKKRPKPVITKKTTAPSNKSGSKRKLLRKK